MKRRKFIKLIGGGAIAWPLAARAQQPPMPVVGFLRSTSLAEAAELVTAFRQGMKESGYVDGVNVRLELRSAEGQPSQLPALVADWIRRPVSVIAGDAVAMRAAKTLTTAVPIVFAAGGDPVRDGLVPKMNRPGGNVTGVNFFAGLLGAKRLEQLRLFAPKATTIAMLVNPNTPSTEAERGDVYNAAQAMGQQMVMLDVSDERDIEVSIASLLQRGVGALLVGSGPVLSLHREQIVGLAARHELPASYPLREFAVAGGLMSYGASITEAYRQAGIYAGRILMGEKPGELPVMRSTKFEFVINLKTAKAIHLEVPPTLLATADEVID